MNLGPVGLCALAVAVVLGIGLYNSTAQAEGRLLDLDGTPNAVADVQVVRGTAAGPFKSDTGLDDSTSKDSSGTAAGPSKSDTGLDDSTLKDSSGTAAGPSKSDTGLDDSTSKGSSGTAAGPSKSDTGSGDSTSKDVGRKAG